MSSPIIVAQRSKSIDRGDTHQHAWFLDSKSSKTSEKRDWYIWKDPKGYTSDGTPIPPNNWCQLLGDANSAWTFDVATEQFYLSLFTPEQPDLNWETPAVRVAVHDAMKFWLEKGVCGYRMDVINLISKDQRFPDAEETNLDDVTGEKLKYHPGTKWYTNGPRMHEYLQEIKRKVLEPYHAVTVGEMPDVSDIDEIIRTVHEDDGDLNMIFIFDIVDVDNVPGQSRMALRDFKPKDWVAPIIKWQRAMLERDGWNSVFIENHDQPRSISRYTDDSDDWRDKSAKVLALLQTTLSGTLFVYQGEEIGMRNVPDSWPESEYKDIEAINFWKKSLDLHKGDQAALREAHRVLQKKARDNARTPMQWNGSPHAGFCSEGVKPWMRVNDDYQSINTEAQMKAQDKNDLSVWQYWQRGLAARKQNADVFVYGDFKALDDAEAQNVFAYTRTGRKGGKWIVVLNLSGESVDWVVSNGVEVQDWKAGTYVKGKPEKSLTGTVALRPWEGLLGKCVD